MPVKTKEDVYDLYGRKAYADPLQYVKSMPAGELGGLDVDEEGWVELVAFPASAAVQVIPWEGNDERQR